jgi:hypothetical protein
MIIIGRAVKTARVVLSLLLLRLHQWTGRTG